MKILFLSDAHGDMEFLEEILTKEDYDVFFSVGDLTNYSRGLENIVELIEGYTKRYYLIPGNMEIPSKYEELGLPNLHGRSVEIKGYQFIGIGGSNPTPFNTPFELEESEIREILRRFWDLENTILLSHTPPKDTTLDVVGGKHVGSVSVREFIMESKPILCICGHIHENGGKKTILNRTFCVNVARNPFSIEI